MTGQNGVGAAQNGIAAAQDIAAGCYGDALDHAAQASINTAGFIAGASSFAKPKTVEVPSVAPNSTNLGNLVHYDELNGSTGQRLPTALQNQFSDTEFYFARRGQTGPDVEVLGGTHPSAYPGSNWNPLNDFGDFKPDTPSGARRFLSELRNGKLPENTQWLPYDPITGEPNW